MKSPRTASLLLSAFILIFQSCNKERNGPRPTALYSVGRKGTVATYWKDSTSHPLPTTTPFSDGTGIAVSGQDVYVCGYQFGPGARTMAMLWKNGVAGILSDTTREAVAWGMTVDGTDVYVAGYTNNAQGQPSATLWKNGVAETLSPSGGNDIARGVAVVGRDVYVVGTRVRTNRAATACYWKNGTRFDLGDTAFEAAFQSIAVEGTDVYTVWSDATSPNTFRTFYARNFGTPVRIDASAAAVVGKAIAVSQRVVYIAGWGNLNQSPAPGVTNARYWRNGAEVLLTNQQLPQTVANAIAIDETDVYVAGATGVAEDSRATIWHDGKPMYLTDSGTYGAIRGLLLR